MEHHTAITNNQRMVSILHKELGRKVEILKHMVRGLATKDQNKSELPAYELTVLDHSIF